MSRNYQTKGFGYGHAKTILYELLITKFSKERERFSYFMQHPDEVEDILLEGAKKARMVAQATLNRVRVKVGFKPV